MLADLTARQRAVLEFYVATLTGATGVQIHRAGWWGDLGGQCFPRREIVVAQLVLPLNDGGALHFYGSLGDTEAEAGTVADHEHQFICTFDFDHEDAVHLVAFARAHHVSGAPLIADSSFLLDETHPLRERGYTNVLVTRADLFSPFEEKNQVVLAGVSTQVLGLVPLEPAEWQFKLTHGTEALFEAFRDSGRDLLALRPKDS